MSEINLEGAYQQLEDESPFPWQYNCKKCNRKVITELNTSYLPEKDRGIKLFRPLYCPKCNDGLDKLMIKVIAEIKEDGKIYPRNKKGRVK